MPQWSYTIFSTKAARYPVHQLGDLHISYSSSQRAFLALAQPVGLALAALLPWSFPPGIYYRTLWSCLLWGHLIRVCIWSFLPPGWSDVQLDILLSLGQRTPKSFDCHCGHCLWRWTGSSEERDNMMRTGISWLKILYTDTHTLRARQELNSQAC